MMQQERAPVPALSKKTEQVTVTVGESQLLALKSASSTPLQHSVCFNTSYWWDLREAFTSSAFERAMLHQLQTSKVYFSP